MTSLVLHMVASVVIGFLFLITLFSIILLWIEYESVGFIVVLLILSFGIGKAIGWW